MINGNPTMVVGVYQESEFAIKVIQQPEGDFTFLPDTEDYIVQLAQAKEYFGSIGLAAHNNLSGRYIPELEPGEVVQTIYGDGTVKHFLISEVSRYQAISPDDLYSDFRDLENDHMVTSTELFEKAFGVENRIGFITCIPKEDVGGWGRIVVIGVPVE